MQPGELIGSRSCLGLIGQFVGRSQGGRIDRPLQVRFGGVDQGDVGSQADKSDQDDDHQCHQDDRLSTLAVGHGRFFHIGHCVTPTSEQPLLQHAHDRVGVHQHRVRKDDADQGKPQDRPMIVVQLHGHKPAPWIAGLQALLQPGLRQIDRLAAVVHANRSICTC